MEAYAALVGANGVVELYAIAQIGLHLAFVVHPSDTEGENAVWLNQSLYDFCLFKFGVLVVDFLYGNQHFLYGLQIFHFAGVLCLERCHNLINFHNTSVLKVTYILIVFLATNIGILCQVKEKKV